MIADSSKTVERIEAPIPLELTPSGSPRRCAALRLGVGPVEIRPDRPPAPTAG